MRSGSASPCSRCCGRTLWPPAGPRCRRSAGPVVGFLVVLVFFGIFDAGTTAEWVALPVASFLAAYAPSAISFVVGQASFTVAIVLLFDIIDPEGWRTGVVRVEDIAIGAAVSLVVGLLLWPRGAVGMLRRVLGAHLRGRRRLPRRVDRARSRVSRPTTQDACHTHVCDAARRVGDAYDDLLAAPGTLPPGHETWGAIGGRGAPRAGRRPICSARQRKLGFVIRPFPDAAGLLRAESDGLGRALRSEADAVEHAGDVAALEPEPVDERRAAEAEALRSWGGRDDARRRCRHRRRVDERGAARHRPRRPRRGHGDQRRDERFSIDFRRVGEPRRVVLGRGVVVVAGQAAVCAWLGRSRRHTPLLGVFDTPVS